MARRLAARLPTDPRVTAHSTLTIARAPDPPPARSTRPHSFAAASFASSPRQLLAPVTPPRPRPSRDQLLALARATAPSTAAAFTPLPDDILLPFIDRPAEVAALIATPPSAKLFALLEKTLAPITQPSTDPARWSYTQLHHHLTAVSRQHTPDALWVLHARQCIMAHSELIWERVKGALGVPPELDLEPDLDHDCASSHSSLDTDEISDDHGRSARGHWDDWDAIMDSPVFARPTSPLSPTFLSIEPLLTSNDLALGDIQEEDEQAPTEDEHDPHLVSPARIQGLRISTTHASLSELSSVPTSPISPRSRPRSGSFVRPPASPFRRSASSGSLAEDRHDPLFPASFASLSAEPILGHHGDSGNKHGAVGGSVSGYKRLSWGSPTN